MPTASSRRTHHPTLSQLADSYDEKKKLEEEYNNAKQKRYLSDMYTAIIMAKFPKLEREDAIFLSVKCGIRRSLVRSRLKSQKKEWAKLRQEYVQDRQQLMQSTLQIDANSLANSRQRQRGSATHNSHSGQPRRVVSKDTGIDGEDECSTEEVEENVLHPVHFEKISADNVTVRVDGENLTERELIRRFGESQLTAADEAAFREKMKELNNNRKKQRGLGGVCLAR